MGNFIDGGRGAPLMKAQEITRRKAVRDNFPVVGVATCLSSVDGAIEAIDFAARHVQKQHAVKVSAKRPVDTKRPRKDREATRRGSSGIGKRALRRK